MAITALTTYKDVPIQAGSDGKFRVLAFTGGLAQSAQKQTPEEYHDLDAMTLTELKEKIDRVAKQTFKREKVWVAAGYSFDRDSDEKYVRGLVTSYNTDKSYRALRVTPEGGNNQEYSTAYLDNEHNRAAIVKIHELCIQKAAIAKQLDALDKTLEQYGAKTPDEDD